MHGLVVSYEARILLHIKLNYEEVIYSFFVRFPVTHILFLQQHALWKL
jgi:hypothetical protein